MESEHTTRESTLALAQDAQERAAARMQGDLQTHKEALHAYTAGDSSRVSDDQTAFADVLVAVSALTAARAAVANVDADTIGAYEVLQSARQTEDDYLSALKTIEESETGYSPVSEMDDDDVDDNVSWLVEQTIGGIAHFAGDDDGQGWRPVDVAKAASSMADFTASGDKENDSPDALGIEGLAALLAALGASDLGDSDDDGDDPFPF